MSSVVNHSITKQPLKIIEIPLAKFSEEVIPHHQKIFEQHRVTIQKLVSLNNDQQLLREVKEKKRTIRQLKDLMYELDTLRTQVEDSDLDKFDTKTLSLRKIILKLISGYQDLEKAADKVVKANQPIVEQTDKENLNPFEGASQIQIQGSLEELKLIQQQDTLNRVENINRDVEDLHEMYRDLHGMVEIQGENVEHIETTVTSAKENVNTGLKDIVKAHILKAVAYPVTGAFLGSLMGGPIGLVAGIKVGGIAALGCAVAGYTGGKFFNKANDPDGGQHDAVVNNENNENNETQDEKKDI